MAVIRVVRRTPLDPAEAWHRLTRWERHADRMPLTRMLVGVPAAGPGARFTARTGVGPLGFDDPMRVVEWRPPDAAGAAGGRAGVCRIVKEGRLVTGWARIEVRAAAPGCEVVWHEEARVAGLPRWCDAAIGPAGRLVFGRVVDALLRP